MSTRCYFGIMREGGEIALHYCHHDGYPTGVGRYLLDKANTAEAVRELKLARERVRYCEPCEQKESEKRLFVDSLVRQLFDLSRELEKLAGMRVIPIAGDTVEL